LRIPVEWKPGFSYFIKFSISAFYKNFPAGVFFTLTVFGIEFESYSSKMFDFKTGKS